PPCSGSPGSSTSSRSRLPRSATPRTGSPPDAYPTGRTVSRLIGGPGLALAPGVQRVVDEGGAFEKPVIVGLDREATEPDRQEPWAGGIAVQVGFDVGGVDDARQADQRGIVAEVELVDEHLEAAPIVAV